MNQLGADNLQKLLDHTNKSTDQATTDTLAHAHQAGVGGLQGIGSLLAGNALRFPPFQMTNVGLSQQIEQRPEVQQALAGMDAIANFGKGEGSTALSSLLNNVPATEKNQIMTGFANVTAALAQVPTAVRAQLADLSKAGILNELLKAATYMDIYKMGAIGGTPQQITGGDPALMWLANQVSGQQPGIFNPGAAPTSIGTQQGGAVSGAAPQPPSLTG